MFSRLTTIKYLPLLLLAASLVITCYLWNAVKNDRLLDLENNFDYRAYAVTSRLNERVLANEQILLGVQALFSFSTLPNSKDFKNYVSALQIEKKFKAIHGVMYVKNPILTNLDKPKVIFTAHDLSDYGYDFLSDSQSRSVIEQAINTGKITVTDKLPMLSESKNLKQSGFLIFVPIYIHGAKLDTFDQRHSNCKGLIAGLISMDDLMSGVLGENASDLGIEIYSGKEVTENKLIYKTYFSNAETGTKTNPGWFKSINYLDTVHYPWTLAITSLPHFEAKLDKTMPLLIFESGCGISILLAFLVWILVRGRARALVSAAELGASQAKLHAILDNSPIGIWFSEIDGRYRFVNKEFCNAFGMTEQQFLTKRPSEIFGVKATPDLSRTEQFCLKNNALQLSRESLTFADGKPHLLEITRVMLTDDNGINSGTIGIMKDITEATELQNELKKSRDELESRVLERTRDLEASTKKLALEMQARKKLEHSFLKISEETQAQIGRELHDDLGQLLSGIAYVASSLFSRLVNVDEELSKQAGIIKTTAQDAIKRTRYITHGLVPFNISIQGLQGVLEQFANDVLVTSGIPCSVHWSCDKEITDFMISTNLYRITQEAVNNAVKHSGATNLSIELNADSNEIRLKIIDNGVGLPKNYQDKNNGMGILNMKYRARLIGASISMTSDEGKGTGVLLTLPIAKL